MLSYRLNLVCYPFTETEENTRYFSSIAEQKSYFDSLIATDSLSSDLVNFNIQDLINTQQVFNCKEFKPFYELLKYNYCVLIQPNGVYRYYFAKLVHSVGKQVVVQLSLDDIQTNYFAFHEKLYGVIERAHLNRFTKNGDGTFSFDLGVNTPFLNSESVINSSNKLVSTFNKLYVNYRNQTLNSWMKTNVKFWCYVYYPTGQKFMTWCPNTNSSGGIDSFVAKEIKTSDGAVVPNFTFNYSNYAIENNTYSCFAFPIYKSENKIYFSYAKSAEEITDVNSIGFDSANFVYLFGTTAEQKLNRASILNIKYSIRPPMKLNRLVIDDSNVVIKDGDLYLINLTNLNEQNYIFAGTNTFNIVVGRTSGQTSVTQSSAWAFNREVSREVDFEKFEISNAYSYINYMNEGETRFFISANDIKEKSNSITPKDLTNDVASCYLTTFNNDEMPIDLAILNAPTNLLFTYVEPNEVEISKSYVRLLSPTNEFLTDRETYFSGLVINKDTSIVYSFSALEDYLRNNKNFFLQNSLNIATNSISSFFGIGKSAITGDLGGALTGTMQLGKSLVDNYLEIDNIKSRPNNVKLSGSGVLFNSYFNDLAVTIVYSRIREFDRVKLLQYLNLNGYLYRRLGYLKDFDNLRVNHNFIQANIEDVKGLSNEENARLKTKLNNGIRFWITDEINYDVPNYERNIE